MPIIKTIHVSYELEQFFKLFFQMVLLNAFVRNGFCPTIVRDGRKIKLMEIKHLGLRFLTSNAYFNNSNEYELANQYGVKFQQVFFPNKFCTIENFDYDGEVPTLQFFLSSLDSKEEKKLKTEYVSDLNKIDYKWNFKKELEQFCEQKLFLLTCACLKFIKDSIEFQLELKNTDFPSLTLIHPFGFPLCTLSGFVYKLYKVLILNNFPMYIVKNEFGISTRNVSLIEYEWVSMMEHFFPEKELISAFNNNLGQKYFKEAVPDLYSPITKQAFFFHGCVFHGHFDNCSINPNAGKDTLTPFGKTYEQINTEDSVKLANLLANNSDNVNEIIIQWECRYRQLKTSQEIQTFLTDNFKPHPLYRLKPRTCVRGSFFDNYALCWSKEEFPNENMYFLDINGLYSYCAIKYKYMIGKYKTLIGKDLTNLSLNNNQFFYNNRRLMGSILLTILPPKNLFHPFLMYRNKKGKTINTLCAACCETENKVCKHSDKQRALTSTYMISEIEFALTLNYKILNIHECHIYEESDYILRDFVKILNFFKTKYSNLKKNSDLTNGDYLDFLNNEMELKEPFLLSERNVSPNVQKRTFYKLMANALFGKFQQKNNKNQLLFVNKHADLENIYNSGNEILDLFCINDKICQVEVTPNVLKLPPNKKGNCYIGAQITAYARQTIYSHLLTLSSIGSFIYQIDCDSLLFSLPLNQKIPLKISDAVGHFKHEISGEILNYYSLGPKNYTITFKNNSKIETISRVRGLSLNNSLNEVNLNSDLFKYYINQFLNKNSEKCVLNQFRKKGNFKRLKIESNLERITFSNELVKRRTVNAKTKNYATYPLGYSEN